jgi:hypothetical protein
MVMLQGHLEQILLELLEPLPLQLDLQAHLQMPVMLEQI